MSEIVERKSGYEAEQKTGRRRSLSLSVSLSVSNFLCFFLCLSVSNSHCFFRCLFVLILFLRDSSQRIASTDSPLCKGRVIARTRRGNWKLISADLRLLFTCMRYERVDRDSQTDKETNKRIHNSTNQNNGIDFNKK